MSLLSLQPLTSHSNVCMGPSSHERALSEFHPPQRQSVECRIACLFGILGGSYFMRQPCRQSHVACASQAACLLFLSRFTCLVSRLLKLTPSPYPHLRLLSSLRFAFVLSANRVIRGRCEAVPLAVPGGRNRVQRTESTHAPRKQGRSEGAPTTKPTKAGGAVAAG